MYKAKTSFVLNKNDYAEIDIKKGQILSENFASEEVINDLLQASYIEEYDGTLEIYENGMYNVEEYENVDVDISSSPILQNKDITVTENTTTNVSADTGYDGLGNVSVTTNVQPTLQTKNVSITSNGNTTVTPDNNYDGLDEVNISTNVTPNLQNKSVTITSNTTTTIEKDTGYDGLGTVSVTTNVSGGADLSEYFQSTIKGGVSDSGIANMIKNIPSNTTVEGTSMVRAFQYYGGTTIPLIDTSNVTSMVSCFSSCVKLTTIPLLNTSKVTNFNGIFSYCSSLTTIPVLDTSSATNMSNMFASCSNLTDEGLNNILAMCVNATSYTGTKTTVALGLTNPQKIRCQQLSNWSNYVQAGWS